MSSNHQPYHLFTGNNINCHCESLPYKYNSLEMILTEQIDHTIFIKEMTMSILTDYSKYKNFSTTVKPLKSGHSEMRTPLKSVRDVPLKYGHVPYKSGQFKLHGCP